MKNNEANKKPESEEAKLERVLFKSVEDNDWTADELEEAYYLLCGVVENSDNDRVLAIFNLMNEMTKQRYPLNRFVTIISGLREWEDSVNRFTRFIDDLGLTQREKDLLQSIVDKSRLGTLRCTVDEQTILTIKIDKVVPSIDIANFFHKELSARLRPILERNRNHRINFWFEED